MAAFTGVVDIGGEPSSRLWENWSNNILAAEEILADWSIITAHSTVKCTTYSSLLAKTKFRKSQSESDATYGQTNKMLGVLMSECIATSSDKQQWITVVFCILSAGVRWCWWCQVKLLLIISCVLYSLQWQSCKPLSKPFGTYFFHFIFCCTIVFSRFLFQALQVQIDF